MTEQVPLDPATDSSATDKEAEQPWSPAAGSGNAAHRTLAEHAFNEIRRAIVSGELAAGQRLRIRDLASALELSPMPIREALRKLDTVGLVEQSPHRGARVSLPSPEDLHDLVRARLAVEPLAASVAAQSFRAPERALAEAALNRYHHAAEADNIPAAFDADRDFHFAIYNAAESPWLRRLIVPLWDSSERYRRAGTPGTYQFAEREREHAGILEACVEHDEARAFSGMLLHLTRSANRIAGSLMGTVIFPDATD